MKAIVMSRHGGPDCLELKEIDTPAPESGEVLVKVVATAVNRADVIQRKGRYPAPPGVPADIPGLEYAGIVEKAGGASGELKQGDRVFGLVAGGSYAEYVVAHHRTVAHIPEGVSFEQAAAIPEAYTTAYDAMICQGGLSAGDTVLISAVGSGVGTAACQIARAIGARSIGLSRGEEKIKRARALGLDEGIVSGGAGFAEKVMELTGGNGVDVVLELVGGDYVAEDIKCMCLKGRLILVGLMAGTKVELDLARVLSRRLIIRGTTLRARPLEEKIEAGRLLDRHIAPLLAGGRLEPVIDKVFPLSQAAAAHEYMESNDSFGKIILQAGA